MRCKFSRGRIKAAPLRGEPIFQLSLLFLPPTAERDDSKNNAENNNDSECKNMMQKVGYCDFKTYVKVLEKFIFNTEKLGIDGLAKQYRKLESQGDVSLTFDAFKQNMTKNRYSDVICRDSTRVKLLIDSTQQGDYIHANYVNSKVLRNTYICTQGPLQTTISDFWRMVFQERTTSILMLCRPIEEGRPKCVVYWPDEGQELCYGCIRVLNKCEKMDDSNSFETVNLVVNFEGTAIPEKEQPNDKSELNVTLIKWPNWPDRGVPDEKCHTVPHKLLAMVRHGPCVVHCSAGIGRTGCMIALEFAHRMLSQGEYVDFEKIALELRKQRAQCIQTEVQYLYIHRVMVAFARGENGISADAQTAADNFLRSYDEHLKR
ncbi:unnamed protein product [Caenorhabditis bovis]|uniref:Protein-tyrosine-phosphatase n=1 Tax=Caenorhabditis bovis TaxID=2654633 RepID=A0A8S1ELU2_9PELO|nr:unnamed protein product [Caenorhabditis bovis]